MDKEQIIKSLSKEFSGKSIVSLPLEVICELEPTKDHPSWSEAIAYIKQSEPHYHERTVETYTVENGLLRVVVDDQERVLKEGEQIVIEPPSVHRAYGDWVRVRVYTEPGWIHEDHILLQ